MLAGVNNCFIVLVCALIMNLPIYMLQFARINAERAYKMFVLVRNLTIMNKISFLTHVCPSMEDLLKEGASETVSKFNKSATHVVMCT